MTFPRLQTWPDGDAHRRTEISVYLGSGDDLWQRASRDIMRWAVKTRSGFSVDSESPVAPGQNVTVTTHVLGMRVREPVQVMDVVSDLDRVGYSYRTKPGHPVDGEEAFVVYRAGSSVWLTIRSMTRPAPRGMWRMLYPALRMAQLIAQRRYARALH